MNLRQQLRHQRKQCAPEKVAAVSKIIANTVVSSPEFSNAQTIALYLSNENEIDPIFIMDVAKNQHKKICLPILQNQQMCFSVVDEKTQYVKNQFQIVEPQYSDQHIMPTEQIDLFLVPLVAFDAQCHRLGRGAGFYDRVLKNKNPNAVVIGLAYAFQEVDRIIPEPWDVSMDMIVTEEKVFVLKK